MGTFIRRVFWFVVVVGLVYIGYTSYVRWWNPSFPAQVKETATNLFAGAMDKVKTTVIPGIEKKAGEYASSAVREAEGQLSSYIRKKASDALSSIGAKLMGDVGSVIGSSTERFPEGTVPVATSSGFLLPPPSATLVTNVNAPLVFAITRNSSYTIVWGDGTKESGTVAADAMRVVSHAWARSGDYSVVMTITASGLTETRTFPVRIYE